MKFAIFPIFLSGYPCSGKCAYCNASLATGVDATLCLETLLREIEEWLGKSNDKRYRQIALYGNDILGLPESLVNPLLELLQPFTDSGRVQGLRTSLRPDSIVAGLPELLKKFSTIEIGVPSMDSKVLTTIDRGHSAKDVVAAIQKLKDLSVSVGCQTMLGLPEASVESDLKSAKTLASLHPDFVRIHPTLVLRDTNLERRFREGHYVPLSVEESVERCGDIWDIYEQNGIDVIRCGFHIPEAQLQKVLVAGPWHPAYGQLVRSFRWKRRLKIAFDASGGQKYCFEVEESDYSDAIGHKRANLIWLREHCCPGFQIICKREPKQEH